jgi:ribonuclease HI
MISNIWWERNNVVFKDKFVPPEVSAAISISQEEEFKTELRESKSRIVIPPPIDYTIPWGFFRWGQSRTPSFLRSGGGFVHQSQPLYSHQICARGKNKQQSELIALWTLLETAKEKNLSKLQVFGDSKLVIDWARGINNIQNPRLASLLRDIKLTFRDFEWISFQHILRELNTKADELSKEALQLQKGAFGFYEFFEGTETEAMEFCL